MHFLREKACGNIKNLSDINKTLFLCSSRTPAMIGCSFVVDREYFGEIGLLDPGMEVYGGENIELGMRVKEKTHYNPNRKQNEKVF